MIDIKENIRKVREELQQSVTLVAVSKFHSVREIETALEAGQVDFGESYVQELVAKHETLGDRVRWHMIGHLQTNKVRFIAPFIHMIQSVDSIRLVQEIDRQAGKCGRTIDCLLEVHVAMEESKTGWNIEDLILESERGTFAAYRNVRFRGVMGMASNTLDMERIEGDFRAIASCHDKLCGYFDDCFDIVSMGMSEDYKAAVRCGSTMVRVGSSIFGPRPMKHTAGQ